MELADYDALRREQADKRGRGELMGIGVSFFTEGVGAGPRKHMDILGLAMNDGADLRVHPSGKAVVSLSAQTQGQGHETTFAQIVAEELGLNMTYPFGTYAVVVEIDRGTGQWKVERVVAVDDCGIRINPMIVEGQIMGGLAEGFGMAAMELITFDDEGNCLGSTFMDYLLPTSWETPRFELYETVTPSPHHPLGCTGVGESATVGSPAAYVNAIVDALAHTGLRDLDMPVGPDRVWTALVQAGLAQ
jgi:CO/xanthine dehydrogenase Mo-binding subunit